jgi:hypothetical protein
LRLVHVLATLTTLVFVCSPDISPPSMTMTNVAPADDPQPEVVVEKGYALQILAMDALGLAIIAASDSSNGDEMEKVGLLTVGFGPGIVHAAHGRPGAAVASMLMRPAAVYGGAVIGFAMEDCGRSESGDFCGLGGAIVGGVVGYIGAAVFDAAYLAREKRTVRAPSWSPHVSASPNGMQVGVGGSF